MKSQIIIKSLTFLLAGGSLFAQDIRKDEVPSVIANSFQQAFPKAVQSEWEIEKNLYKVEFKTGLIKKEHDAWYDKKGKLVRHKEEISKNDLPAKITERIKTDFRGYRTDDLVKISEMNRLSYLIELEKSRESLKITFDSEGNVLNKRRD